MAISSKLPKHLREWRKNTALIPLWFVALGGGIGALAYLFRLATKCPDVALIYKDSPEPWQKYEKKQYKLLNFFFDYDKYEHPRPKF